jgi:micrococcal nuclease
MDISRDTGETIATASVTRVIDGDTIDVDRMGKTTRVRLIGVDTPEVVDPRKPVQCYGKEASAYTKKILTGQIVTLKRDLSQEDTDTYGRILRYVYLSDGQLFNKKLIAEGYAHEYTYRIPYQFQKEFQAAQKDAAKAKVGLWGDGVCPTLQAK